MNVELRYRIDSELKEEYDKCIMNKYGKKYGKSGSEIEKALKVYMTLNGNSKYQNDPDVQAIFKKANKTMTPNKSNTNYSLEEKLEKKIDEKFEILIKKIETQTRRESSKKYGHAEFKKQFQMAFNEHHQVSRRDLEHFIMNHADIVDKRAIKSRIQYLLSPSEHPYPS